MSRQAYKRQQYHARREILIEVMGSKCALCGETEHLELDHPFGRDWKAAKVNLLRRIILYEQDFRAGNLRLLCKPCNLKNPPLTPF